MSTSCIDSNKGEKKMYKDIDIAIREFNPNNNKELKDISQRVMEEGWRNTQEIVKIHHAGNQDDSNRAVMVLMSIRDLATTPLLQSLRDDDPDELTQDMNIIVWSQLDNRVKIIKTLNKMLSDKRPLRPKDFPANVEVTPPSRRVCDEAYIMMRHYVAYEENEDELTANINVFLDMPDDRRDVEILRVKKSKKWISLVEKALEESELEEKR
jgi:hypothetical protein